MANLIRRGAYRPAPTPTLAPEDYYEQATVDTDNLPPAYVSMAIPDRDWQEFMAERHADDLASWR